jgi:Ricin-type beta-trefoil lectin domain
MSSGYAGHNLYDQIPCDQTDVFQFFNYDGAISALHDSANNCIEQTDGSTGWSSFNIATNPCTYSASQQWSYDENHLWHNRQYGACLDGHDSEICFYEPGWGYQCAATGVQSYAEVCNGGDGNQQLVRGSFGSHPYQHIAGTIHAYSETSLAYVLDVYANGRADGTPVDIAPQNGSEAQYWWYDPPTHEIHLSDSDNMCLDKPGGRNGNGTKLEIWTCNGGANQQWYTSYPFPGREWRNGESNTCLDAPLDDFSNPDVEVWTCNGGLNQEWDGP